MENTCGSLYSYNRTKRGGKQSDIENFLNFFTLTWINSFRFYRACRRAQQFAFLASFFCSDVFRRITSGRQGAGKSEGDLKNII